MFKKLLLLGGLVFASHYSAYSSGEWPTIDPTNPHLYRGMPYRRAEPAFMSDIPDPFGLRPRTLIMKGIEGYEHGYTGFADSLERSVTVTLGYEPDGSTLLNTAVLAGVEYYRDRNTAFPGVSRAYATHALRDPDVYARVHRTVDRTIDVHHPKTRRALSVIPGGRKIVHKVVDHKLKKLAGK